MGQNQENTPAEGKSPALKIILILLFVVYATIIMMQQKAPDEPTAGISEAETTVSQTTEPETLPAGARVIYLTFDDGPCTNTPRVLEILDEYKVRATFFTVGAFVDRYPAYAADIVQHGNLIACHSYSHEYDQCYASADAFMSEVSLWRSAILSACGDLPSRICVRFPGGSTTSNAEAVRGEIIERLALENYRWFDWNAGDNDKWQEGNTEGLPDEQYFMKSYRECIAWFDTQPDTPVIFLLHDTEAGTVSILPQMLDDLLSRGFVFRTLDQHPDWDE